MAADQDFDKIVSDIAEYRNLIMSMYSISMNRCSLGFPIIRGSLFCCKSMNDSVDMCNVFSQTIETHQFTRKNRTEEHCYN